MYIFERVSKLVAHVNINPTQISHWMNPFLYKKLTDLLKY